MRKVDTLSNTSGVEQHQHWMDEIGQVGKRRRSAEETKRQQTVDKPALADRTVQHHPAKADGPDGSMQAHVHAWKCQRHGIAFESAIRSEDDQTEEGHAQDPADGSLSLLEMVLNPSIVISL